MKTPLPSSIKLAAALCVCFATLSAQAQITNGGFESGLSGWTTFGDVSTQALAPEGAAKLFLTTAGLDADESDAAGAPLGPFNASGIAAVDVGTPGGLEQLSGNAIGSFDAFGAAAFEGSLAQQSFTAQAGDSLSFLWNFGTRETLLDHAFVVIDGVVTSLSSSTLPSAPGSGNDLFQTGFQSFSTTFTTSGTHSVAFGVVDMTDFNVRSSLSIDRVQVTAVPEAESWAMGLLGLAGLGFSASRTKRKVGAKATPPI
jgi:hypothetical protein